MRVSVYLPMLPVDLLLRRAARCTLPDEPPRTPGRAVLLAGTLNQRRVVAACCPRALSAGVREGMTLAHARALLPAQPPPVIDEHHPARDLLALQALARWCTRLAPAVQADPPDGLLMDFSGCAAIYQSPGRIVRLVGGAMRRLGLRCRVALSSTFACAWGMARFAPHARVLVAPGRERDALAPLCVGALRLDADAMAALEEVGVDTVQRLLRLPREQIARRLGPGVTERIDAALGRRPETISPVRPPRPLRLERTLDGPCRQIEALRLCMVDLVERACAALEKRERGARRFELRLQRPGLSPETLATTLSRPSRNPRHVAALLWPMLEKVQMGYGVERLELSALRTARLRHHQPALTPADHPGALAPADAPPDAHAQRERLGELVDALAARLGPDAVLRPELTSTHVPEAVPRLLSATTDPEPCADPATVAPAPRPPVLLEPPRPARVISLAPEGPPVMLSIDGREARVCLAIGPERIAPRWWLAPPDAPPRPGRDYFRVRDQHGQWLWVFRQNPGGRWFLHGLWA